MWVPFVLSGAISGALAHFWKKWKNAPTTEVLNRRLIIGGMMPALAIIITLFITGAFASNTNMLVMASVLLLAGLAGLGNDLLMPMPVNILYLLVPLPLIALDIPILLAYIVILPVIYLSSRWQYMDGLDATSLVLTLLPVTIITINLNAADPGIVGVTASAALLVAWWFSKPPASMAGGYALQSVAGVSVAVMVLSTQAWYALIVFIPHVIDILLNLRNPHVNKAPFVETDRTVSARHAKFYSFTDVIIGFLRKVKGTTYPFDVLFSYSVVQGIISGAVIVAYFLF